MTPDPCPICQRLKPHPLLLANIVSDQARQQQPCAACGVPFGLHLAVHPHVSLGPNSCPGFQDSAIEAIADTDPRQLDLFLQHPPQKGPSLCN